MTKLHKQRLGKIIRRIKENPQSWEQDQWHCGTSHCVAGHAQIDMFNQKRKRRGAKLLRWWDFNMWSKLTPREKDRYALSEWEDNTKDDATNWLGLTENQCCYLFHTNRTLHEIIQFHKTGQVPVD